MLQGIVENTKGPAENKRKLYVRVINSMLLYAAPVWASEINRVKGRRIIFNKINRLAALRVIRAYRTVSLDAATLLARTPPIDIIAIKYLEIYNEINRLKLNGQMVTMEMKREIRIRILEKIPRQWKRRLKMEDKEGGARVRAAILPVLEQWMYREGELTFEITQMLTGHGVFKHYLWRMNKIDSPKCNYCNAEFQDNMHIIMTCPQWREERMLLRAGLCTALDTVMDVKHICKK